MRVGILGGSGLYDMEGFEGGEEHYLDTPFGAPADAVRTGTLAGVPVAFLPRHGRGHRYLPSEVPYRANLYALKKLGCEAVVSISVVGSMREEIRPGDLVLPDQLIDKTFRRPSTFFGDGVAAHVSFAEPYCHELRATLAEAAGALPGATLHLGGLYVCMEGPQFSTRAESLLHRQWSAAVIGMTNAQEAKLAREAEMCLQTVALATDYDCWHQSEAAVTVEEVMRILHGNIDKAKRLLREAVPRIWAARAEGGRPLRCGCQDALRGAIMTAPHAISAEARSRLGLLIERHLPAAGAQG